MFTGLQGQKIMYTILFLEKVCKNNPGFDKDKTDVMFGLTLYDFASFISLYVQVKVWKTLLKIKTMGLAWRSFFLLLLSFFRLIPWSIEAPGVHLSARVSKIWTGRRSASSFPWETRKAPVASVNGANFLSRSFIGFLCKPRNISLFLSPLLSYWSTLDHQVLVH